MIQAGGAVFGSADPGRPTLGIKNLESARAALRSVCRALAGRSHGIKVFSGDRTFIEAGVVSGFVISVALVRRSIGIKALLGPVRDAFFRSLGNKEVTQVQIPSFKPPVDQSFELVLEQ